MTPWPCATAPESSADDELIQRIRRSSLLLNTRLRDLLTLAKGEAGHLELRPEPFDACALVESVTASALDLAAAPSWSTKSVATGPMRQRA